MKLLKVLGILIILSSALGVSYILFHKETYTVSFNTAGGSKLENIAIKEGEILKTPDDPTKNGFIFSGWYEFDKPFTFNKEVTNDIILTAKWEPITIKTYTLEFDSLNGEIILPIKISEDSTLDNIPKPQKDGYKFLGWYYENHEFNFKNKINKDMVLIAKWEKYQE